MADTRELRVEAHVARMCPVDVDLSGSGVVANDRLLTVADEYLQAEAVRGAAVEGGDDVECLSVRSGSGRASRLARRGGRSCAVRGRAARSGCCATARWG